MSNGPTLDYATASKEDVVDIEMLRNPSWTRKSHLNIIKKKRFENMINVIR